MASGSRWPKEVAVTQSRRRMVAIPLLYLLALGASDNAESLGMTAKEISCRYLRPIERKMQRFC